jgi:hypothetical protein
MEALCRQRPPSPINWFDQAADDACDPVDDMRGQPATEVCHASPLSVIPICPPGRPRLWAAQPCVVWAGSGNIFLFCVLFLFVLLLLFIYLLTKGSFGSYHLGLESKNSFMILTNTCLATTELVMNFF